MTQDKFNTSEFVEDQKKLEESIGLSRSRFLPSKLRRRVSYHQRRRTFWLAVVVLFCVVLIHPMIEPLLHAAFLGGNLIALSIMGLFFAAIYAIIMSEKLDDE